MAFALGEMIVRQYLAFVIKINLSDKRVQPNGPGAVIHADDAELAMQEAKMHIPTSKGETIAVTFLKDLTPLDVPDRYRPIPVRRWDEELQLA